VTPAVARRLGRAGRDGALVGEVVCGGPAARAGVRAGDVVVALNSTRLRRAGELPRLVARADVGSDAAVQIVREGRERRVPVRLGELPERAAR
jgi:serine protease Do